MHGVISIPLSRSSCSQWHVFAKWLARERVVTSSEIWIAGWIEDAGCVKKGAARLGVGTWAWRREATSWRRLSTPGKPDREIEVSKYGSLLQLQRLVLPVTPRLAIIRVYSHGEIQGHGPWETRGQTVAADIVGFHVSPSFVPIGPWFCASIFLFF